MDVRFIQITQNQYDNLSSPEEGTFYYCTDTERVFLGDIELSEKEELFNPSNYTPITSGSDLNDYTEVGFYYGDATTMQSLDNAPVVISSYSLMFVIKATSNRIIQFIFEHNEGCAYYRLCDSSKKFSLWHTILGSKRTTINGIDLNDLQEEGIYWVQKGLAAVNAPTNVTGSVRVIHCYPTASNPYVEQEWHNLYDSDRYRRCCDNGKWSEWVPLNFNASYDANNEMLILEGGPTS